MPFNINNIQQRKGTRFTYNADPDEWIEIRILTPKELDEINKATRKRIKKPVHSSLKKNGEYDTRSSIQLVEDEVWLNAGSEKKAREMQLEKAFVDWQLFDDSTGELVPFPFTIENVQLLVENDIEFMRFYSDCLRKLTESMDAEREDEEKN